MKCLFGIIFKRTCRLFTHDWYCRVSEGSNVLVLFSSDNPLFVAKNGPAPENFLYIAVRLLLSFSLNNAHE